MHSPSELMTLSYPWINSFDVRISTSSFDNNLKLRWNNMISSPQDKANILSILACDNMTIDSWER